MFLGAIIVLCTNVLFSFLFLYPTFVNFIAINFLDTIAQAFTAVCFITFLVGLVDRRFTAIQYAFLASLVIIPGTLMKGSSGFIVGAYGFYNFFMIMGFLGIPAVCLSYLLYKACRRQAMRSQGMTSQHMARGLDPQPRPKTLGLSLIHI